MNLRSNIEISKNLPFHLVSPFALSQLFQTSKDKVLEKLENNNFAKNMIKHVNGFSKNNYTCNYYDDENIKQLTKRHVKDSLKIFHVNIESFARKGNELSTYLSCLNINFDIICITEIRSTTISLIN